MYNELPFNIRDISQIIGLKVIKNKTDSLDVVCPYCGDARGKANLCIRKNGERKDLYSCKNCGAGGNMLKLYADFKGYDFDNQKERKRMIKEIINSLGVSGSYSYNVSKTKEEKSKPTLNRIHSDKIYRALLNECKLLPKHRSNLIKRGLSNEDIVKYLIKSVPYDCKAMCKKLVDKGFNLNNVPGFFMENNEWNMKSIPGFFCPVYDVDGYIVSLQIRADMVRDGRKYLWFSSPNDKCGTAVESAAIFLGDKNATEVVITEGILKAIVYHVKTNTSIIGMPGISDRRTVEKVLSGLKNVQVVHEAFDMDKCLYPICKNDYKCDKCKGLTNNGFCFNKFQKVDKISADENKLINMLHKKGYVVKSMYWDYTLDVNGQKIWNEKYKGIDDFVVGKEREKNGNKG